MNQCKVIVRTNGSMEIIDHAPDNPEQSLEQQQAIVGGLIEHVYPRQNCQFKFTRIIANEEGWLKNLPNNFIASYWFGSDLVGDVIVIFRSFKQFSGALVAVLNASLGHDEYSSITL